MTYFAGLSRCAYFDRGDELDLIAVGWLSSGPHAQGSVAPGLVAHLFDLIVDHGYCPPESFQAALMACPRTDSVEYFRRIAH
jgi:hypothetical protein